MPIENAPTCQYVSPEGEHCKEVDMGSGMCFWHDANFDKTGMDLSEKLERYARGGGLLKGLKLKRVHLKGVNLVNRGSHEGYDLSYSDLYRADLKGAHLFNAKIGHGSLMKADLRDSNLHCADLTGSNLLGVKLDGARIDNMEIGCSVQQEDIALDAINSKTTDVAKDNLEQSEEIYRNLRKAAENNGLFEMAGRFIYKELTMRRYQMPLFSKQRIFSKTVDLLCGYGEKPQNVVAFSLGLIFICALGYFVVGVTSEGQDIGLDFNQSFTQNISDFFSTLYYSVVTFTTLGYGDIAPIGLSRLLAAVEAFIGSFTIALFVVVFVKKMTR